MPFQITVHAQDRILEVVYPPQVTTADLAEYLADVKKAINDLDGEWSALVDQSQLRVMPSDVVTAMASLNAFAQLHGMKRSARVVTDAPSGLQAWRMTKRAMLSIPTRTFETRGEALQWLRDPDAD
ncbi:MULTISPECIES: STAS/SEC14 domain-containing protein [unclassified Myxococcus]|uniref:STAS/SEC14 domain-containing protein n=1 Tax=unclassified Myxococcus TaxID=2648731 RepID=UPI0015963C9B|nr:MULTISPECIES: STAS/SEC14 domain-containing protein [unclassified Myxococcus]NVJ01973.1 STAS/SEC14 domain-containing protein [Myxococcus sp. AM009]NVJ16308.1 STAS/SEC14 domain-containing protein [Myxococcus sp. AM010]WIG93046.1 STAS/SEC14 domain-containing protein [Myxococcus sp. SDU36]